MTGLWDTHVHLQDPVFADDLPAVLERARQSGVTRFILAGVTGDDAGDLSGLAGRIPGASAAFGIHPLCCKDGLDAVSREGLLERLQGSLQSMNPSALGEIGLDKYAGHDEDQAPLFRAQLALARERDLPVLLHCRKRFGEMMSMIRADGLPGRGGIYHAFSGSADMAREALDAGLRLGLGGVLTFKNAHRFREVAAALPLDAFVLETDAPDITPEPHRGTRNEPAHLRLIFDALLSIRTEDADTLAAALDRNCIALFDDG